MQLVRCMVDVGDLAQGYTKGGQYLQIKVGDSKPAFYAIASPPAPSPQIELLVKNQGDTAQILCDSKAGGDCSAPPLDRANACP
jgi:NAD(P)H-flavin reductase